MSSVYFTDPDILARVQVDRGAIKFVLSGANIMCRKASYVQVYRGLFHNVLTLIFAAGLTSKGGSLGGASDDDRSGESVSNGYSAGTIVAVYAEGKQHAIAIGELKMSTDDIRRVNKGIAIETLHYLGDPLWKNTAPATTHAPEKAEEDIENGSGKGVVFD
jgi:PUA domain protein